MEGQHKNYQVKRTSKAFTKANIPKCNKEILSRTTLQKTFKRKVDISDDQTIIVTGPPGLGKTALIEVTFGGTNSVVRVNLNTSNPFLKEEFARDILGTLHIRLPPATMSCLVVVEKALRACKDKPFLVVEADRRCNADQLEKLLFLLKWWAADQKLVRPLIILSASRSALGMDNHFINDLCYSHLCASCFNVPDLTEEEGEEMLWHLCRKQVTCTKGIFPVLQKGVAQARDMPLPLRGFFSLLLIKRKVWHSGRINRGR